MSRAGKYKFTLKLFGTEGSDNVRCESKFTPAYNVQEFEKNYIVLLTGIRITHLVSLMRNPEFDEQLAELMFRFSDNLPAEEKEANT